jgi:DNA-binding NtrC family response regulator
MAIERILIVDDESGVRGVLADLLRERGYQVLALSSLFQARELIQAEPFDLILCDIKLPDGNGLEFLQEVKKSHPAIKLIIVTGFASMDTAVQAIHLGVFDYLIKPVDPARLDVALDRLNAILKLEAENRYLRTQAGSGEPKDTVWGNCPSMQRIRDMVQKLGRAEATVLIQGESGTGKEVVARALCAASDRADKPFIRVNCAAIPANLLESEFFGHEKGAFTGAVQKREGRFELASGGTLLLDEISEIPPELQVKLLRVLQEREFERVGGNKTIRVDVKIIATTNRHLREEVSAGRFREDLYYRLNVVPIELPPLRERGEDVILLAREFLKNFERKHAKHIKDFSPETLSKIRSYPWPGNVRELQNLIERAVILAQDGRALAPEDMALPEVKGKSADEMNELVTVAEMEKRLILRALKRFDGNRTYAAEALGVSLRTMRNKIAEYRGQGTDIPSKE